MNGTKFTIDRKIFNSDIWRNASPWKFKLWIYLLGNANWADGIVRGQKVERGQILTSYRHLRKELGYKIGYRTKYPAVSTVKSICEELTKEARTTQRTVHHGTLITLLNYNELQPFPKHEANSEANRCRTLAVHKKEELKNKRPKPLRVSNNGNYPDHFEDAWGLYNRRGAKKLAYERYQRHVNQADIHLFKAAIPNYLKMCAADDRKIRDFAYFIYKDGEPFWMNFTEDIPTAKHPYRD